MTDGKKRRKKKLKKSLSSINSESTDNGSAVLISTTTNSENVPDEIVQIKQEHVPIGQQADLPTQKSISQAMPMNLTSDHGKIKDEIDSIAYNTNLSEPMEIQDFPTAVCKIGK